MQNVNQELKRLRQPNVLPIFGQAKVLSGESRIQASSTISTSLAVMPGARGSKGSIFPSNTRPPFDLIFPPRDGLGGVVFSAQGE